MGLTSRETLWSRGAEPERSAEARGRRGATARAASTTAGHERAAGPVIEALHGGCGLAEALSAAVQSRVTEHASYARSYTPSRGDEAGAAGRPHCRS